MALPGRLVLLGHPVAHSISPAFQNAALRASGMSLVYEALDVTPTELDGCIDELVEHRAAGNVTIPHKERVARRCASLTPVAERVGAANSFRVDDAGTLLGHNTDVAGFDHLARSALGDTPLPRRVAVLGAGGAAAAVLAAIEAWPHCSVVLCNRKLARAAALAERFPVVARTVSDAALAVEGCELVVNTTPLGLHPGDALPVAIEALPAEAALVDLVYGRAETAWVRAARAVGHHAVDGLDMLLEQGALAFEWWFGVPAPRHEMQAAMPRESGEVRHPREGRQVRHPSANGKIRHPREGGDPC